MDEVTVDIDDSSSIIAGFDNVIVPDLLVQSAGFACHYGESLWSLSGPISGLFGEMASDRAIPVHFVMESKGFCR
jgi:acetoin utilization deacetylase AcuC-like enzyme